MRPCLRSTVHFVTTHLHALPALLLPSFGQVGGQPLTRWNANLKLQSPHAFSSPENTGGFPILGSMIPRPAGVSCGGGAAPSGGSTGGVGKNCSAHSLCISCRLSHNVRLPLSLNFSLSLLLSCHAHDSRSTTQRQLRYHVQWRFPRSITCVVNTSQCRASVRRTWMTWE